MGTLAPFFLRSLPSGPSDRAAGSIALMSLRIARYVHFHKAAAGPQMQFNRKKQQEQTENKNIYPIILYHKAAAMSSKIFKKKKKNNTPHYIIPHFVPFVNNFIQINENLFRSVHISTRAA